MYLTFNGSQSVPIPREQKADAAHAQGITSCKVRALAYVIKKYDSMITIYWYGKVHQVLFYQFKCSQMNFYTELL